VNLTFNPSVVIKTIIWKLQKYITTVRTLIMQ